MGVFTMPSLGADMESGKLVEWLVQPGDTVKRGDVVAVVETQKGAIEIEIFEAGEVRSLDAALGETLPVGAPLATIVKPGEDAPEPAPPRTTPPGSAAPPEPPTPPATPAAPAEAPAPAAAPARHPAAAAGEIPAASPAARRLAAEKGLDLSTLVGSGPGGAIVRADVEAATGRDRPGSAATPPARKQGLDLSAMREAIAAAMARSKREIPHYYLGHDIDLQAASDWLAATNADRPAERRLLMGALFVKAAALAANKVKAMNGHYADGAFAASDAVHAGVAVALRGGGLVAPAIRDAQTLSLDALMEAMRDLVMRARSGRLRSSEMTDGTITVSSLGEKGVDSMTGVIYPPQVALVAFGTPRSAPRAVQGEPALREVVTVTLAADHRVSDGRRGAQFLAEIDTLLQHPEAL